MQRNPLKTMLAGASAAAVSAGVLMGAAAPAHAADQTESATQATTASTIQTYRYWSKKPFECEVVTKDAMKKLKRKYYSVTRTKYCEYDKSSGYYETRIIYDTRGSAA